MFGLIFIVAALLTPQVAGCLNKKVDYWFFESYRKSSSINLKVYTHIFYANELNGPAKYKNLRLYFCLKCLNNSLTKLFLLEIFNYVNKALFYTTSNKLF